MASYAYLKTDLNCPYCEKTITDMIAFQWGYCPGNWPRPEHIYQLYEKIRWKSCIDGSVPIWAYLDDTTEANIGDTSIKSLLVRDSSHFWSNNVVCDSCKRELGGAVVKIENGTIQKAWIYKQGEIDDNVDIFVILSDEHMKPMPEWNDHKMIRVKNCKQ